ncbi:murein L,D-transpeptidase [Sphingomonas parva]|uniref:Murein L,D-transpeptidase n=1 Tax=Sphingomonas parva TaxID=2555898 RepID=A0A4Y8ZNK6_9SPHN|nr:L,D-transpeptidase family protein [Sphingomonas parva]TFI57581.1 murein L,D-transpeptidase [Sphingomonas parva]
MRRVLVCVSVAALLVAGCGNEGGSGGAESAEVNPKQVSPEALQAAVKDERARKFYAARNWAAVWSDARAEELTGALGEAVRHGLNVDGYLEKVKAAGSPAEREASLTVAALDYAQTLAMGAVDPRKIFEVYEVPMNKVDVVGGLGQAIGGGDGAVKTWLAGLAPQDEEYKALQEAYVQYRQRADAEQRAAIQPGDKIAPGDRDPRVPQIAQALQSNGYLAAAQPAPQGGESAEGNAAAPAAKPSNIYTPQMVQAVKKVQTDYGIEADGIIGNSTLEALNTGAKERARILAVNLERRRWLERTPPKTRIDVNTAAAELAYWRDGQVADRRRVVVGQPDWETPELGSPIFRLVANPDWVVPESIAKEEILPKGAAYMAKENIVMKNGRLVQQPGPKSALGLVKFDMANDHAIYLHDTPAKALFASTNRHSSHGCARVEDALGFARMLADQNGVREQFEKALATKEETPVSLPNRIPVRLLYHSAYLDGGRVVFRTDPYGWDDLLAKSLGFEGQIRPRVKTHVADIGP